MLRQRFHVMRVLLLLALVLIAGTAAASRMAETSTTIILVRHAEKGAEPANDPPLTPVGEARAAALVEVLRTAGITAIYSTPYKRTQQTVAPLAQKLGVAVTTFDGAPAAYAAELLEKNRGRVVLVAGHSNTVPGIARALGVTDAAAIADSEYDNLYIVTVPETGPARAVRAKYGAR